MGWTRHTQNEERVSFPYVWVNGHVTTGALLPTLRTDLVQRQPVALHQPARNESVFTVAIPENLSKTAEILEAEASLLVFLKVRRRTSGGRLLPSLLTECVSLVSHPDSLTL